jgi:hypothetical protein
MGPVQGKKIPKYHGVSGHGVGGGELAWAAPHVSQFSRGTVQLAPLLARQQWSCSLSISIVGAKGGANGHWRGQMEIGCPT